MSLKNEIVFGPVPSRRLGRSLGINNIPHKTCSYSCIYCQVGVTKSLQKDTSTFYSTSDIYDQVKRKIADLNNQNIKIDYLCFVSDGEPTLDKNLARTIILLREFNMKIAVISNASLIWESEIQNALSLADYVSLKIDSLNEKAWHSINRPEKSLKLAKILDGIKMFRESYKGILTTETMLVDGYNTNSDDLIETAYFISYLQPHKAYLSIPTRPPALSSVKIPDFSTLEYAYRIFKAAFDQTEFLNYYEGNDFYLSGNLEDDFLKIINVHPMRKDAVEQFLQDHSTGWSFISGLINQNRIKESIYNGELFYTKIF